MQSLLDFYLSQSSSITHLPQVEGLRREAQAALLAMGFPTREDEDWKYSHTDAFSKRRFEKSDACPLPDDDVFPLMPTSSMSGEGYRASELPEGMIMLPWEEALALHAEKIAPVLGRVLQVKHGFHAQNTAMLSMGLFIYVPKHTCLDTPLRLVNRLNEEKGCYLRHVVVLEEGASMTLIEDYQGHDDTSYFTNVVTEVYVHAHASFKHYKIVREGALAYHVGHLAVKQEEHSSFESHSFAIGGQWVRSDIDIQLTGQHASCLMNGIYMTRQTQHLDHHTKVQHQVPHCTSHQDYKGLVTGASRVVFNGIVNVSQHASKTVAHQSNKNLLLSKQAEVDTKPQLEIYTDDVVCTHGATVGQLDDDALFYLEARGIEPEEARSFLMRAFVEANLQKMGHDELLHWMTHILNQQMGW